MITRTKVLRRVQFRIIEIVFPEKSIHSLFSMSKGISGFEAYTTIQVVKDFIIKDPLLEKPIDHV